MNEVESLCHLIKLHDSVKLLWNSNSKTLKYLNNVERFDSIFADFPILGWELDVTQGKLKMDPGDRTPLNWVSSKHYV